MQPADIRFEPWVWVPFSRRRGRVLPTVVVAAVAAAAGYMMGRHSDKADIVPPQKTVAVSPIAQPAAVNKKTKLREAGEKPDLALKSDGETAKHIPALTQTKPEPPPVVLLNPRTADPKGNLGDRTTARESSRAAPARASNDEPSRSDAGNDKPRGERAEGSRNSMRDYRSLREYMLGR
jgi:hypothetical protein